MVNGGLGASFGVKIMSGKEYDNIRYIAIRNAPKFITGLLYNNNIPPNKVASLEKILKSHIF
jgi:hypothetical protein